MGPDDDGVVRAAHTDFLPAAEVERVDPNENIADVEFGMEALAALAASGQDALRDGAGPKKITTGHDFRGT
jgi:hypothetical protein